MGVLKVAVYQDVCADMKTIYKYPITSSLNPLSVCIIQIPKNHQILSIQVQCDLICVWALVDTSEPLELKEFLIAGTGQPVPENGITYLKTIQSSIFIWHIFERV